VDVPARRVPCVLGTRHVAVSKGVGARRSTKLGVRAACRILATPRKEVRPKARRTKLAITPRA